MMELTPKAGCPIGSDEEWYQLNQIQEIGKNLYI
jgi:hypothetical protein